MHKLAQSALAYIHKHDLLRPGERVGVAVSGGADSVALLRMLLELRQELGIVLSVVHLNHTLRGAESDADEQFVQALATAHDVPFISERRDVKAYAAEKKLSLETAARELRYEFFNQLLRDRELNKIATAHTLDDQAETVLLKLVRGAGTRGIAGIYPKLCDPGPLRTPADDCSKSIVRPLLATRRPDLEEYLAELPQTWREDSTNHELRHTRNRIRHEILPALEKHVNPRVREVLSEIAEIARAEEEFWSEETKQKLYAFWKPSESGGALHCARMDELALALRRRMVRAAAESIGLNLEFCHVEDVLALSQDGESTSLPDGWPARRLRGEVHFERLRHPTELDYEYKLCCPGKTTITQARLVIEAVPLRRGEHQRYNPEQLLGARFVGNGLVVRNWRAGDRFWSAHTKEPKKIKELLQDRHITGDEKKRWPVIASGDEVVWLRGFGVRRDCQAKDGEGVLIREDSLDSGASASDREQTTEN